MTFRHADHVRDTWTGSGTGTVTVSGTAPIGYRTFSAIPNIVTNDTLTIVIVHDQLDEWETSVATFTSPNSLARTRVIASSNAGNAVNFSTGLKHVALVTVAPNAYARTPMFADTTINVRTDGVDSDARDGLTTGTAFLTIAYALGRALKDYDTRGFTLSIQLGIGTFDENVSIVGPVLGGGTLAIVGTPATPSNHTIRSLTVYGAHVTVDGLTFGGTATDRMVANSNGHIGYQNLIFAANSTSSNIFSNFEGICERLGGTVSVIGDAGTHFATIGGDILGGGLTSFGGSPTPFFSTAFAFCSGGAIRMAAATFSGSSPTGKRYFVADEGYIETAATVQLPGDVEGTTDTGGRFNQIGARIPLFANLTLFVRTDGADNEQHTGLANTSAAAFLTGNYAISRALRRYDFRGFTITIQFANGTYAEVLSVVGPYVATGASGFILLRGDPTTPSNVVILGVAAYLAYLQVDGFQFSGTAGTRLYADFGGAIDWQDVEFTSNAGNINIWATHGGFIRRTGGTSLISGSAAFMYNCGPRSGIEELFFTTTLSGSPSPTFTTFALCFDGYLELRGMTWSGSALGQRYSVQQQGVIYSLTTLPGDSAGVASGTGEYL